MYDIMVNEAIASTSAGVSGGACAVCLTSFGVDPTVAAPIAIVAGVVVRLVVDFVRSARKTKAGPSDG